MSGNDALLPCPFCGARDHKPADEYTSRPYGGLINEENPDANCISCDNCLAHGPLCDETKGRDTIAAWNRRAPASPSAAAGGENPSAELGRIADALGRLPVDRQQAPIVESIAASLRAVAAGIESATAGDGWTEVTDDPATWTDASLPGRVLAECGGVQQMPGDSISGGVAFTHVYDEACDARRDCAPSARGRGRIIRWMPWPSAIRAAATAGQGG